MFLFQCAAIVVIMKDTLPHAPLRGNFETAGNFATAKAVDILAAFSSEPPPPYPVAGLIARNAVEGFGREVAFSFDAAVTGILMMISFLPRPSSSLLSLTS